MYPIKEQKMTKLDKAMQQLDAARESLNAARKTFDEIEGHEAEAWAITRAESAVAQIESRVAERVVLTA
jgi:hypothetical protein